MSRLFTSLGFFLLFSVQISAQAEQWLPLVNFENRDILFLFDNGPDLYAGVAGKGVQVSADEGATWQEIPLDQKATAPTSLRKDQDRYYLTSLEGGMYQSDDAITFSKITGDLPPSPLWASTVDGNTLYVAGNKGVYSTPKNAPGVWLPELPTEIYQHEVLFDIDAKAGLVVAGGRRRLYLREQQTQKWRVADFDFQFDIRNIHIFNNHTIWVGTNGSGAYMSMDQGYSWTPVDNDMLGKNVIFFSKSEPENLISINSDGLYQAGQDLNKGAIVQSFKNIVFHQNHYYSGTTSEGIWKLQSPPPVSPDETGGKPIQEGQLISLNIFPNPSGGRLTAAINQQLIEPEKGYFELQFFDVVGKMILRAVIPNSYLTWQEDLLLEAPPGIYRYDLVQNQRLVLSGQLIISK